MTRLVNPSTIALSSRPTEQRASVENVHVPFALQLVEVVSFSGGDSFGLVSSFAADMEREGRKPQLEWKRDRRGIIDGLAIVENPR